MATVVNGSKIKLNNGQVINAENGGWYDAQQFWNGSLGAPGVGNNPNQTDIYGKNAPTFNPADAAYVKQQQATYQPQITRPAMATPSTYSGTPSAGTPGTGTGVGFEAPASIDLPKLYESLYQGSGIRNLEAGLSEKTDAYNAAVSKIKDNPYLSEATMTGRISKLDQKFAADTQAVKNDIATQKADIETKLNLQTKQLDLNNQATQQAWQQFNTLLSSGALNNASGEDIANITRATGISSNMIQSAIAANNKKNVQTQVFKSEDDNGNVTISVIDQNTGDVINQQSLGAIGNKQTSGSTAKADKTTPEQDAGQIIKAYLSDKNKQAQISPEDLYRELLLQYPAARVYLEGNFTPQQIRGYLGS